MVGLWKSQRTKRILMAESREHSIALWKNNLLFVLNIARTKFFEIDYFQEVRCHKFVKDGVKLLGLTLEETRLDRGYR